MSQAVSHLGRRASRQIASAAGTAAAAPASIPGDAPGPSKRAVEPCLILIVEDDFMLRSSLAELLRGEGYRVESCANGADALLRLQLPPQPSVILLDIMLPYMDGVAFREAQLASPAMAGIPVIVITAVGVDKDVAVGLRFERTFYKPLDIPKLLTAIAELCGPMVS
jgi:CheY-like chemotaxis protein